MLFDAGRGVMVQLSKAGVPLGAINTVFLTHHHFDHIGDLYDVMLNSWMHGRKDALRIYGPPDTERLVNTLVTQVYDKDITWAGSGRADLRRLEAGHRNRHHSGPGSRHRALEDQRRARLAWRWPRHAAGLPRALDVSRLPLRGGGQGHRDIRRHGPLPRPGATG
ncbi:MBL fold metallo-hydrolase [Bradyrhizobium diazoefficiens]|uniref:MBL fold metallo-hydrolase n=1 Tax=Bradyrhizobium diazoefficiens TaxID=1355477 RepID=UPI00384E1E5F